MSREQEITRSQERRRIEGRRIEGLRILARIIARHYLAHPELYPDTRGQDGAAQPVNGHDLGDGKAAGRDGERGP